MIDDQHEHPADTVEPAPSPAPAEDTSEDEAGGAEARRAAGDDADEVTAAGGAGPGGRRRRRGSRGGRGRKRSTTAGDEADDDTDGESTGDDSAGDDGTGHVSTDDGGADTRAPLAATSGNGSAESPAGKVDSPRRRSTGRAAPSDATAARRAARADEAAGAEDVELPDRPFEGRIQDPLVAAEALVRKPQIGDTRPAPPAPAPVKASRPAGGTVSVGRSRGRGSGVADPSAEEGAGTSGTGAKAKRRRKATRSPAGAAKGHPAGPAALDERVLERRRGRERNGRPVGRYLMCVHVRPDLVQIAVLEGRNLIEHYVSRPSDDVLQIHGNVYLGRVQNVLPGMEAAFVDIGTPKNAVLYRGDVQYDSEDLLDPAPSRNERGRGGERPRIEQMLKNRQLIVSQVTKNPIGAKGARLTQEVSLPGRFVVLIPNSKTYGISKRLADDERRRLRSILDRVKPEEHGLIVRTAAENVSEDELRADVLRLAAQWDRIAAKAKQAKGPALLYREPGLAVRVIREELNADYRGVVIDDPELFAEVRDYVGALNPELADRIEYYDPAADGLPMFEQYHVHEQLHKALDRKVWLPSGGSLIIEHTEALTVIDVNTGKNVGSSNLEETVFQNNLEAADEIARQLRLRDIGGIIVIDFIDMEIRENRMHVVGAFRDALARDKTRTQVFDISELGLVEMTRKRVSEGLVEAFSSTCPHCNGRGFVVDESLLE